MEDSVEENIYRKSFNKALQFVIDGGSVKSKFVSNRVFLPIPKNNTFRDAFNNDGRTIVFQKWTGSKV